MLDVFIKIKMISNPMTVMRVKYPQAYFFEDDVMQKEKRVMCSRNSVM